MLSTLPKAILRDLQSELKCTFVSAKPIGGGCISRAYRLEDESGAYYFLKYGADKPLIYQKEANGLNELSKAKAIKVPHVIRVTDSYLLLEWIDSGHRNNDFWREFGVSMANLHRFTGSEFGLEEDNYLGDALQINSSEGNQKHDWIEFYWAKRLKFQMDWAFQQGLVDRQFMSKVSDFQKRIQGFMQDSENIPVLLHGDLWSGNFLVARSGEPVLIDPAIYYGNREAELAMTMLFGGFDPLFYEAYQSAYPLPDGYKERIPLYKLYHILNHLNLFGKSYWSEVNHLMGYYLS